MQPFVKITSFLGVVGAAACLHADVAPDLPDLDTALPAPNHIVMAGVALSAMVAVIGWRMVRKKKTTSVIVLVELAVLGTLTAGLALSSKNTRAAHHKEVLEILEGSRRARNNRNWPEPKEPGDSGQDPPELEPPALDPPQLDDSTKQDDTLERGDVEHETRCMGSS